MPRIRGRKKGLAFFMVLALIIMASILAAVILSLIQNQHRLTLHQISRIQAYYASLGAVNFAFDKIRIGDANWPIPASDATYTHNLCRGCSAVGDINEPDLPMSVQSVAIVVAGENRCSHPPGIPVCISATATYTYN